MARDIAPLIVVDGFAGTGKSTTAQQLWLALSRGGREATWFHEHEIAHPIFEYGQLDELLRWTPERLEQQVLAGWERCAADDDPGVRIIEGSFFQIPVAVMLAMNAPAARIRNLLLRIDAIVAGRGGALIYLFRSDLRQSFQAIGEIRGESWLQGMTAALAQSPYGQRHRVRNIAGLIEYYRRQQTIIESVLRRMITPRIAIDVSASRWDRYQRTMSTFLRIPRTPPAPLTAPRMLRHVGTFRGAKSRQLCRVVTDAQDLFLQLPRTNLLKMLHVEGDRFCLEGLAIDVRFAYGRDGEASRFKYQSRMVTEVLSDTSWIRA